MSPPELTGDAPVPNLTEPSQISLLEPLRHMLKFSGLRRLDSRLRQLLHLHKPLIRQHRLDDRMTAVAFAYRNHHVVGLHQISGFLQISNPLFPAFVTIHSRIFPGVFIHRGIRIDAGDNLQIVTLPYLKVVGVVGRRNLHGAGALLRIRIGIRDNGNFSSYQRQDHLLSDHISIAFILRANRDRHVSEHSLRPGCGNDHISAALLCRRIAEIPVEPVFVLVFHLRVRQRCSAAGAPVDQPVASVYQSFFV